MTSAALVSPTGTPSCPFLRVSFIGPSGSFGSKGEQ